MGKARIAYEKFYIEFPLTFESIKEFRLEQKINDHGRVFITGILEETEHTYAVEQLSIDSMVEIGGNDQILFRGMVVNAFMRHINDVYELQIEAADASILLDIVKKKRSFQDTSKSYINIMKIVMEEYDGKLAALSYEELNPSAPIIQYEETDWEFLKRMASHLGTYIQPDAKSQKANIYVGSHVGHYYENTNFNYQIEKNLMEHLQIRENSENYTETEPVTIVIETDINYDLGDKIKYQGKQFTIVEKTAEMKQNVLLFTYKLQSGSLQQAKYYNDNIAGASIEGTVISVDGDKVKLHFNIDDDKEESNAYSYLFAVPYTANGNTGWFFMPTPGEHAFLYIPSKDERKAYITKMNPLDETANGIRNNPATRYLGTPENKLLLMKEDELLISGEKNEFYIRMRDDNGISVISQKDIHIKTGKKIKIKGKMVSINAKNNITLATKKSSIIMDAMIQIRG